ncbi:hypothetical protein AGDE_16848 [Angomonas deanei]|uniref:Transmembrane protein n=1 Tax=Angomonas deanei TaxID=59799 RepID=A0A7G2C8N4_9TRYP|nr:hypothetical protein AGDE_16848 [Angomonas deanei]CAD2216146.1 hypothetical protein, conserved [Angomonas deanei]|eukprot:EPY16065.1 hypothetical protein AGDE_16848 [Angomonas deanei]
MFVFAVDANGEWSLTTDLNLLTIQLHYLPVQGNQVGVDLTGSVPGSPTAGWTAESMLGADTFAAAGLRGMPPPRPRVGGYYGNMNYVIPEVLSLLLLAILLVLLVALYLFGVARRKGEVQELRATTVEPNFEHNNDRSWEEMGTRAGGNLILLDASQEGGVAKGGDLTPDEDDDDPNADRLSLSLSLSDDEREEARKERERLANVPPPPAPVEEVVVPLARTDRRGSRRKTSSTGDSKKTPETTSESSNKRGRRKPYVPLPVADLTTPFIPPATRDPGPSRG